MKCTARAASATLLTLTALLALTGFGRSQKIRHLKKPGATATVPTAFGPSLVSANPGVVEIDQPEIYSKIYAISDVHGMYEALLPLLQSAKIVDRDLNWTAGRALLVVVGDSIDKGPESIEVLDFWMTLGPKAAQVGGRVLHLLGNHEAEFLSAPQDDHKAKELLAELQAKGIATAELTDPSYPRAQFLLGMPVAARVGNWLFCHAGFMEQPNFAALAVSAREALAGGAYSSPFLIGDTSLLEAKDWWEQDSATRQALEGRLTASGLFGVVFGHQPSGLNVKGNIARSDDLRLIKLDNGMAPEAGAHPGSVLVFEDTADLNQMVSPRVAAIHSGSSAHVGLVSEVGGKPINDDGDE